MPQKTNTSPMMPSTTPASQAFNLSCIDCTMLPPFHTPRRGQIWLARCLKEMAEWTGLEPATPGVTGRYSNQLNYHSACWWVLRGSNPRPSPCKGDALPAELSTPLEEARKSTLAVAAWLVPLASERGLRPWVSAPCGG